MISDKILQYQFVLKTYLSKSANKILHTGIGCRNENFRILEPGHVKSFDFFDSLDYIIKKEKYHDVLEKALLLHALPDIDRLDDFGVSAMYHFCSYYLQSKDLYATWVTTKEGVIKNYDAYSPTDISHYKIPGRSLILCDDDAEGVLIATASPLMKIEPTFKKVNVSKFENTCVAKYCPYKNLCARPWTKRDPENAIDYSTGLAHFIDNGDGIKQTSMDPCDHLICKDQIQSRFYEK